MHDSKGSWIRFCDGWLISESEQGKKANYPRFYRQALDKLAKEQRILSRRKKGSKRWEKQRLKLAKMYEKIKNQRMDFLHHKSKELASTYDAVIIKDLDMKTLVKAFMITVGECSHNSSNTSWNNKGKSSSKSINGFLQQKDVPIVGRKKNCRYLNAHTSVLVD